MHDKKPHQDLIDVLIADQESRGISMREQSRQAGMTYDGAIQDIIRRDNPPGVELCQRLAEYLDVPLLHVLRLAGWIEWPADSDPMLEEARHLLNQLGAAHERSVSVAILRALTDVAEGMADLGFDQRLRIFYDSLSAKQRAQFDATFGTLQDVLAAVGAEADGRLNRQNSQTQVGLWDRTA